MSEDGDLRAALLDAIAASINADQGGTSLAWVAERLRDANAIGNGDDHRVLDVIDDLVAERVLAWGAALPTRNGYTDRSGHPYLRVGPRGASVFAKRRAERERERKERLARETEEEERRAREAEKEASTDG